MRNQLLHLIETAKQPNVTIQVIPFDAGAHPAMESTFDILEFSGEVTPSLVYVEGLVGNMYLERSSDLERYELVFANLRNIALDPQDSIEYIAETAERYKRAAVTAVSDAGSAKK